MPITVEAKIKILNEESNELKMYRDSYLIVNIHLCCNLFFLSVYPSTKFWFYKRKKEALIH